MAKLVIGNNKTVGVPVITKEIEKLPALGLMRAKDANGKLIASTTESQIMDFTGVTDVSDYVLAYAYRNNTAISGAVDMSDLTTLSGQSGCNYMFGGCTGITSVDLSSLTTVSGGSGCGYMFYNCTGLTSADLSALTTISGSTGCSNMFFGCTGLTSVDLSALTTISGNTACQQMFNGCTGLTSVDLSALTTISGSSGVCQHMFNGCTGLTSVNLNGLNVITKQIAPSYAQMFQGCTHLESVTLGGLTASTFSSAVNQIQSLFTNATGNAAPNGCTLHFPSNFDPSDPAHTFDASTLTGYPTFGGSASYIHVAFDLPASE